MCVRIVVNDPYSSPRIADWSGFLSLSLLPFSPLFQGQVMALPPSPLHPSLFIPSLTAVDSNPPYKPKGLVSSFAPDAAVYPFALEGGRDTILAITHYNILQHLYSYFLQSSANISGALHCCSTTSKWSTDQVNVIPANMVFWGTEKQIHTVLYQ